MGRTPSVPEQRAPAVAGPYTILGPTQGLNPCRGAPPGGPGEGVGEEEPSGPLDLGGVGPHPDRQLPRTGEPLILHQSRGRRDRRKRERTAEYHLLSRGRHGDSGTHIR